MRVEDEGGKNPQIAIDHPDRDLGLVLTMNAMGTASGAFLLGLIKQLNGLSRELTTADLNYAMAALKGIKPCDHIESMLGEQMVAVHIAAMRAAARVAHAETVEARQLAINDLNRCTRTFASQVDALKRHRSNGEQTVKVQHVVVNDGGQAIVGNVQHGGGGGEGRIGGQSHGPNLAAQDGAALLSNLEAVGAAVPGPGGTGQEGMPLPRREGGRANGKA
jgi:hypothetical protein